jgi:hypothetical protein
MGFWVIWENGGSTVAKQLNVQISRTIVIQPEEFVFDKRDVPSQPAILGPRSQIESGHINIPIDIISAAFSGNPHLFIWGWADYKDVFNDKITHFIEFCYEVFFSGVLAPNQCNVGFRVYGPNNREYDEYSKAT